MQVFQIVLFVLLIICALATALTKNLLASIIIFMSYSVVMAIMWMLMQAPDLAITEAAVGAGVSSLLFFLVLRRIRLMGKGENDDET